jgi:hypothetical protein
MVDEFKEELLKSQERAKSFWMNEIEKLGGINRWIEKLRENE